MKKTVDVFNGLNYIVYTPNNGKTSDLPLMIYLHGAGERGTKIDNVERRAIPRLISCGKEYEAVVLCPQCPAYFVWDNIVEELKSLIDKVVSEYSIKSDRICLTGSSMGGFGTWMMGLTYRNFFSAIGPVAGGAMAWRCSNLKTTPVFAVHGDKDDAVYIEYSQFCVDAVNNTGGNAKLKTLIGYGHNDGIEEAYINTKLTDWLLKQRRTDFSYVPEALEDCF